MKVRKREKAVKERMGTLVYQLVKGSSLVVTTLSRGKRKESSSFERESLISEKRRAAESCKSRKPASTVEHSNRERTRLVPLERACQVERDGLSFELL